MKKIYIDRSALEYMKNEIIKVYNKNIETGGIIIGSNKESDDIFITHIIDGGFKAFRKKYEFKKDMEYSKRVEKMLYNKYGFYYIGDWHTHRNNELKYSLKDYNSIMQVSNINEGHKMIFIISCDDNSSFKIYSYSNSLKKIVEMNFEIVDNIETFLNIGVLK